MNWDEKAQSAAVADRHALYDEDIDGLFFGGFGNESDAQDFGFRHGARWQREALLSDESVERAARAVLAHDPDRMECHDHPEAGCCPAGCHDFTETDHEHQARAMLTAAIEGEK